MKLKRSCGILAHPTSFPGPYGIGDLGPQAFLFIDFLRGCNQKLWQILPLHPTSFGDSPYQGFSTFAGNPLLISPSLLIEKKLLTENDLSGLTTENNLKVDYGTVCIEKDKVLRLAFQNFLKTGNKIENLLFSHFIEENAAWLNDYALFVAAKQYFIQKRRRIYPTFFEYTNYEKTTGRLMPEELRKDCFYGASWQTWPLELAQREPAALRQWQEKLKEEIRYQQFLQFEFFTQWQNLKTYAEENKVSIIGDLPIFVSLDSADVWANPTLFHLDSSGFPTVVAGVPPDYFAATGQLWGNPLYDWAAHENENYKWWINRIKHGTQMVDYIRLDHFRGFESYWSIPYGDKTAINGKWVKGPGAKLFRALAAACGQLPIIAEDLGIISDEVTELREKLNLPGMKVLQFAFDLSEYNTHLPHTYKTSHQVVYTGTHDNDTTTGWYSGLSEDEKDFFRRYLNVGGSDPAWDLIRLCLSTTADFAIIPVQDLMGLPSEHRMNTPGEASGNWAFRFNEAMLSGEISDRLAYLTALFDR